VQLSNKMADASPRFVSVCEEDLDKVLNDYQIYTKANTLFARDFYRVIVDEGAALVNYHAIETSSSKSNC